VAPDGLRKGDSEAGRGDLSYRSYDAHSALQPASHPDLALARYPFPLLRLVSPTPSTPYAPTPPEGLRPLAGSGT